MSSDAIFESEGSTNFIIGSSAFAEDLGIITSWFQPAADIAEALSNLIGLIN